MGRTAHFGDLFFQFLNKKTASAMIYAKTECSVSCCFHFLPDAGLVLRPAAITPAVFSFSALIIQEKASPIKRNQDGQSDMYSCTPGCIKMPPEAVAGLRSPGGYDVIWNFDPFYSAAAGTSGASATSSIRYTFTSPRVMRRIPSSCSCRVMPVFPSAQRRAPSA